MQDHIRRNYALVSDIRRPHVFMARGRQSFPQGLHVIANIFKGRLPAHVYAHRYFMEKQSDPSQPSPQLHITEESQGILKVMGGMRYMRDDSSKLDGTLVMMTDPSVTIKAKMLCVHEDDLKAQAASPLSSSTQERVGMGVGSAQGFQGAMNSSHGRHIGSAGQERPIFPSPEDEMSNDAHGGVGSNGTTSAHSSYRFFHVALYPRAAPTSLHPVPGDVDAFQPVFQEKEGMYTVLYAPIEVGDRTFADLIHKLHVEKKVVGCIVLPTRYAWRHVQLWGDAFPDAAIVCSTAIPMEEPEKEAKQQVQQDGSSSPTEGGCQVLPNGLVGLVFPEVDEEELAGAGMGVAPPVTEDKPIYEGWGNGSSSGQPSMPQAFGSSVPFTASLGNREDEDALVDQLLLSPGEMYLKHGVGLRAADRQRVAVLGSDSTPIHTSPHSNLHFHALTPSLTLIQVMGDESVREFVLYDANTRTLACTDLYHGEYSDLDPVNSWVCRVWFKFMKGGNHKRTDIVPRYKWLAVRRNNNSTGTLAEIQDFVDRLTRSLPIDHLLYSHGTPPLVQDAANAIRVQWSLKPLKEEELPKEVPSFSSSS